MVVGSFASSTFSDIIPTIAKEEKKQVAHVAKPEHVKTIYMTACIASTNEAKMDLVKLIEDTEINSVIIDIKNDTGTISFNSDNPKLIGVNGPGCKVKDMGEFIALLHSKNIYVIGRVSVFQDPYYSKVHPELAVQNKTDHTTIWKDHKGISFVDVGAKEYWDYIIEIAKVSYDLGFDEINFDYVRFPSDGLLKNAYFPFSQKLIDEDPINARSIQLEKFFKYLYSELKDHPMVTSVDLFGLVTNAVDDLGIGQVLEKALPYFDYVAPMTYPSHYSAGFNGWSDPNKVPYEILLHAVTGAKQKIDTMKADPNLSQDIKDRVNFNQIRPWLQDFDYGGDYGPKEVRAQIKGVYDGGLTDWMLWSPSNRYTKEALNLE